ncbi:MAG: class I SAM-dependent methyltransferase [Candidatus Thalassarchaeaceae archaeon]|jgi:trans-aconitate methyltransferase|nr:class I SAM-dependent methyltransferase [Candidatus Thalassarchaeaceae archaeon]MDP7043056.1 class I SAM-dependent methyltransferase [Candidatus Thalassarchaeaceae archaeon]
MKEATDIFSAWATTGRDEGMEKGHSAAVTEMLEVVIPKLMQPFTAIDIGCGNGWVVRKLATLGANHVEGIDGAEEMVMKARKVDPEGIYHHARLPEWKPKNRFDLVHSMEFLYYLKQPQEMLAIIHDEWLENGGWLIAGVDHYKEHEQSLQWPKQLQVHMTTMTINEWKSAMENAGFEHIKVWQTAVKEKSHGTLSMLGQKATYS